MYVEKCMETPDGEQCNCSPHISPLVANAVLVQTCNEALMIDYEDKIKCMVWLRRDLFSSTFAFLPFVLDPFFK